jgi:hypothetical protein
METEELEKALILISQRGRVSYNETVGIERELFHRLCVYLPDFLVEGFNTRPRISLERSGIAISGNLCIHYAAKKLAWELGYKFEEYYSFQDVRRRAGCLFQGKVGKITFEIDRLAREERGRGCVSRIRCDRIGCRTGYCHRWR